MIRRHVLIFHLGALGDFILTWPLALALGRLFAQSRILYITHGQKGELAEAALRVESVDIEEGWHHLFSPEPRLPEAPHKRLENAHSIFSFISRSDDVWTRNVSALAPQAQLVNIDPRPPAPYAHHLTDWFIEQLHAAPAVQTAMEQILRSIEQRGAIWRAPGDGSILVHPGSGGEHKCWPPHRFLELIERLNQTGRQVRVVLGEVEVEQWSAAEITPFEAVSEVIRPARLVDLLDLTRRAAIVIANDSGPAHLAGIVATPTVALFGPTDARVWRPLGPNVHIIHCEPLDAISVDRVYHDVMDLLTS